MQCSCPHTTRGAVLAKWGRCGSSAQEFAARVRRDRGGLPNLVRDGGRSKVTRGNPSPLVYELEACRHGVDALRSSTSKNSILGVPWERTIRSDGGSVRCLGSQFLFVV